MRSRLSVALAVTLLFAGLAVPSVAHAEPSAADVTRAAQLKQTGDDAMVSLRYSDALEAYERAYDITRDPALLYNRGRAYEGLGNFPAALDQLEAFDAQAPASLKARVKKLPELLAKVRARVAVLTVRSAEPGARVMVGDKRVGDTPLTVKLSSGHATVEVSAEGFTTYRKEVDLPGGGALTLDAELAKKDRHGVLAVRTNPVGAFATRDGKPLGTTPLEVPLEPGRVVVRLHLDGYLDADASAVVEAGQRQEIDLTLTREPGITSRWWFWTAVGAVVVGGTVLTVALVREKKAPSGDIAPGQIAAPLVRF